MVSGAAPKPRRTVFVSYAHEGDKLRVSVKALADWLSNHGCEVLTDHPFIDRPPEKGWTVWMHDCIRHADVVLIICTPKLKERYAKQSSPDVGKGATFEGAIVTQYIYDNAMRNTKFYPIAPDDGKYEDVPETLRSWWNNHRFPSGREGILRMVLDEPHRDQQGEFSEKGPRDEFGGAFQSRHQAYTIEKLKEENASCLLSFLAKGTAELCQPDVIPYTPEDVVQWFSRSLDDTEEIQSLFDIVQFALHEMGEKLTIDRHKREAAEVAASALYCLAACRLVDHTAHGSGNYLLQVPATEPVIYAIIVTALFGGELRLVPGEQPDVPTSNCMFEVSLPAGGYQPEADFARAAYIILSQNFHGTPQESLEAGPLSDIEMTRLKARLRHFKKIRRDSLAFVVRGVADGAAFEEFGIAHQVPILIPDAAASALLLVKPETLRAQLEIFWSQMCELRPAGQKEKAQPYSSTGATNVVSSSDIHIVAGDGATIAVSAGDRSGAHAHREDGTELKQALQDLGEAFKAEPSGKDLAAQIETAKEELDKTKPDASRVRQVLDTVDNTVKKSAGIFESGEKIAQLMHRAYKNLSPFLDLPPAP